jgi:hypothetical protein
VPLPAGDLGGEYLEVIHFSGLLQLPQILTEKYPQIETYKFKAEKQFEKDEAKNYGIVNEKYKTDYWSLRPDFIAQSEQDNFYYSLKQKVVVIFPKTHGPIRKN